MNKKVYFEGSNLAKTQGINQDLLSELSEQKNHMIPSAVPRSNGYHG
jgi:hypothetical protein